MHGSHGYLGKFSTNRAKFNLQDFVCHPLVHREQEGWEGARSTAARPAWHLVIRFDCILPAAATVTAPSSSSYFKTAILPC
jgi:hypothetical protein